MPIFNGREVRARGGGSGEKRSRILKARRFHNGMARLFGGEKSGVNPEFI
jgi:hypothetical protein